MSEIQSGTDQTLERQGHQDEKAASAQAAPTSVEPITPQDTQAAGATKDTQRELLQGNVSGSEQKGAAERAKELEDEAGTSAGYHSTGSVTGTSGTHSGGKS